MKIRWIDGNSNPANVMTKAKPCAALQKLIDINTIKLNIARWVERADEIQI